MKEELTQEELKEVLHYDPETGLFTWLVSCNQVIIGSKAGYEFRGYRMIKLNGFEYLAHRLVFLYMTGEFPPDLVDHINGVKDDNRWGNLRLCNKKQNSFNRGKNKNNTSGYKGVSKKGKKWQASISVNGVDMYLGFFSTPELAKKVYDGHARKLHGEFAHVGGEQ